jgi:hypothetical protein
MRQIGIWVRVGHPHDIVAPKEGNKFLLSELQEYVGGYVQWVEDVFGNEMCLNEEGLLRNLPVNDQATKLINPKYWVEPRGVRGDVLIVVEAVRRNGKNAGR